MAAFNFAFSQGSLTMTEDATNISIISPREIAAILYRRRYWLVAPLLLCMALALVASLVIRPVYQSAATLLVDSQQIPTTIVPAPLANYSDEQIAKIRQRILSRQNLAALVKEQNLYPQERRHMPLDDVLQIMRDNTAMDLVGSDSVNDSKPRSTIALNLSFTYPNAEVAQAVTTELVTMFRDEDKRLRTEQALNTSAFLTRRVDEIRGQLITLEGKRREIEARYAGALPDQVNLSAQSNSALQAEVSRIDSETQGIMQQNSMLAARSADTPTAADPGREALRLAESNLRQLQAKYSDRYPDVVAARAAVEEARAAAAARSASGPNSIIQSEIAASNARIQTLASRRGELMGQIAELQHTTAEAPQASYELNNVQREYDNLKLQYQDIREKQLEAQTAANLQTEDRGERFSLVNAPSRPVEPIRPKRKMMLAMGLAGGLALGLAVVLGKEFLSGPINGENGVTRWMGEPPLGVIPLVIADRTPGPLGRLHRLWTSRIRQEAA